MAKTHYGYIMEAAAFHPESNFISKNLRYGTTVVTKMQPFLKNYNSNKPNKNNLTQ
jgi:hypothetical protein